MIKLDTKKILIPLDFSKTSLRAVKQGAFTAQLTGGEVVLLHVHKRPDALRLLLPGISIKDMVAANKLLVRKIRAVAKDIKLQYGIKVTTVLAKGSVPSSIADYAEKIGAGIIVMGTMGSDSNSDLFLGSNAYRVLMKSGVPVMTIRKDTSRKGFSKILLPVNTDVHSRQKFNMALQFAAKFGASVHVLGMLGKGEKDQEYKLKVIQKQVKEMADKLGLHSTFEIAATDNRALKVMKSAKKINADLIICMRDETTGFPGRILGTFAHQLLNESGIPVISIPPEEHPENMEQDSIGGMW